MECSYFPMVAVDVERSFSMYKYVLSDRLQSLTESNVTKLNIIQFIHFIEDDFDKEEKL